VGGEVVVKVRLRVPKGNAAFLQEGVNLKPRLEAEQTAHLALRQCAGPITVDGKRFEHMSGQIPPMAFESPPSDPTRFPATVPRPYLPFQPLLPMPLVVPVLPVHRIGSGSHRLT